MLLHNITLLQFKITARIYDDVGKVTALLADVIIVNGWQIQRLHAAAN